MLTILLLYEQSTTCSETCTVVMVKLASSMSKGTLGYTSIIPSAHISCLYREAVCVCSKQSSPVIFGTTLTIAMCLGLGHICLAISSSTVVLMGVTYTGDAYDENVTTVFKSPFFIFGYGNEICFELQCTTFLDRGIMRKIFSSMELVPGRMMTASFARMCNVASVN